LSKKESNKAIIADIVGGMINCSIFIAIAIVIILHSIHRLEHHHLEIDPTIISTVGIFGFAIHCISAFILSKGRKHSFNIHAIFLHTFFDCISTIITFCSGIIILATDFEKTDSIASFIIASLILFSGLRLLKKCIKKALFLHKEIALKGKIEKYLLKNIHHINNLHACEITFENNLPIYSAHVVMSKDCKQNNYQCIEQITNLLKQEFKITKSIIQIEDC
jgi:cobalt-zinc-cadmium efflux system protein